MLTSEQLEFLKGVVTDSGYPYYVVYPEPFDSNNSLIHIYLSSTPVAVTEDTFHINDGVYLQMHHDEYIEMVSNGEDYTFQIPVANSMCYTSTSDTPLYPSIFQSYGSIQNETNISYSFLFLIILCSCIISGVISRLLFGGGRI